MNFVFLAFPLVFSAFLTNEKLVTVTVPVTVHWTVPVKKIAIQIQIHIQ